MICESQLLLVGGMDEILCRLEPGHDGLHQAIGTIPAYHDEDEIDGSVTDDPQVRYVIVWT